MDDDKDSACSLERFNRKPFYKHLETLGSITAMIAFGGIMEPLRFKYEKVLAGDAAA